MQYYNFPIFIYITIGCLCAIVYLSSLHRRRRLKYKTAKDKFDLWVQERENKLIGCQNIKVCLNFVELDCDDLLVTIKYTPGVKYKVAERFEYSFINPNGDECSKMNKHSWVFSGLLKEIYTSNTKLL